MARLTHLVACRSTLGRCTQLVADKATVAEIAPI